MRVDQWLQTAVAKLNAANVPSARLDCLILLEDTLHKDRSWILAHLETRLSEEQLTSLEPLIAQRAKHIPLSYIRHKTEFYGRIFYINEHVLEPRPESETIIEILKTLALPDKPVIVDVGTGSGALAISAKLEIPGSRVFAIDIDPQCLAVTRVNAEDHKADITILNGDLLAGFADSIDVVIANLPYVPDDFTINLAAMNEPTIAIFGGPDGLDLYRQMFDQINVLTNKPRYILAESLPPQHKQLTEIAATAGYEQELEQDFIQLFTVRN